MKKWIVALAIAALMPFLLTAQEPQPARGQMADDLVQRVFVEPLGNPAWV